jgi:hypothetical protein
MTEESGMAEQNENLDASQPATLVASVETEPPQNKGMDTGVPVHQSARIAGGIQPPQ